MLKKNSSNVIRCIIVFMMCLSCFQSNSAADQSEKIGNIVTLIECNKQTYSQNDLLEFNLKFSGVEQSYKCNSVLFELEYDGEAFELFTGTVENDIINGFIPFNDKHDVEGVGGKRRAVAMFTSFKDISLINNEVALKFNFKVKVNQTGTKELRLKEVNLLDSAFNLYNVNEGKDKIISIKTNSVSSTGGGSSGGNNSGGGGGKIIIPKDDIPNSIGSYEAESKDNSFGTNSQGNIVSYNGNTLCLFGGSSQNYIKFNNIVVDKDGEYALIIKYSNNDTNFRKAFMKVNNEKSLFLKFPPTGGWDKLNEKLVKINLKKGQNSIIFFNNAKQSVAIDKVFVESLEKISDEQKSKLTSGDVLFTDTKGHWADEIIFKNAELGLVEGYPDGTVKPDSKITRAEMCAIIVNALEVNFAQNDTMNFGDYDKIPVWARIQIKTAVEKGVVVGYEDNTFRAGGYLTRSEMVTMLVNAFKYEKSSSTSVNFVDLKDVPSWAKQFIYTACNKGLLKGYPDNTIRPNNTITRAEAFALIYQCKIGQEGK
jgi:hypothetical protein